MDDQRSVHPAVESTAADVASMEIRGAAPIAEAAATALATAATESDATGDALRAELRAAARRLHDTRPTAISLANALRHVLGDLSGSSDGQVPVEFDCTTGAPRATPSDSDGVSNASDAAPGDLDAAPGDHDAAPGDLDAAPGDLDAAPGDLDTQPGAVDAGPSDLGEWVAERARTFREELAAAQAAVGRVGGNRLSDGDVVLTHCHSTAVRSCIESATERGVSLSAYVKETRPRMQGHETARDLEALGVDATLVVDGAAHSVLAEVDHVLVGADSVGADGALVNKVGTAGLAASANVRDVPVLVAASTIKCNPETLSGHRTPIEERPASEVIDPERRRAIGDPAVANPAFDRTPPAHLDAIATEIGLVAPASVGTVLRERYGADPPRPWEEPSGPPRRAPAEE